MPAPAQKKPLKPKAPTAPKGPSAKSKTGNSACSAAASNWQLAIRGKASINPDTYQTLAKCRAMTRTSKNAEGRARAGYNLSDQGANAIKGRLQSRFDRDLITQKSREARVKELMAQRKEKQAAAAVAAKPVAAPAPAAPTKFSLGGQLAPGRGTESRNRLATTIQKVRKGTIQEVASIADRTAGVKAIVSKYDSSRIAVKDSRQGNWQAFTRYEYAKYLAQPARTNAYLASNKSASAPAPAKFSRNGKLAPGRGTADPSYDDRATRVHDKANARSKVLMKGVDGTRSTRWEQQQRSNELRVTVDNLRPAVIRKVQKDIDVEKAAAPAPPQAAPMAAKPAASSGTTLKPVKKKR